MTASRTQQGLLAVALGALVATGVALDLAAPWERDVFDALSRAGTSDERSTEVALVLLDEASLDWGRAVYEQARARGPSDEPDLLAGHEFLFPWDRLVYDLIVQFAALGGATAVVFDVELAGPHPSGDASGDATLGATTLMQNAFGAPFVVHAANLESSGVQAAEVLVLDSLSRACLEGAALPLQGWSPGGLPFDRSDTGPYANPVLPYVTLLEPFAGQESLLRLGAVTAQPDPDGVIRRARPFVAWQGQVLPSLGVAAALAHIQALDGASTAELSVDSDRQRLQVVRADGSTCTLPLTDSGDLLLSWRDDGREDSSDPLAGRYPAYPAHRVLRSFLHSQGLPGWELGGGSANDFLDPAVLAGRMLFVGSNAAGLRDLKATPVSADYPGVKVHAAVAEALLDGQVLRRPGALPRAALAGALAALALLLTVAIRSQLLSSLALAALASLTVASAAASFLTANLWLDVVAPVLGMGLAYSAGTTWQWFTAGRQSREIAGLFQHFAPPEVVKQLIARPGDLFLAGENRDITSFFSDIRGFTSLSNSEVFRADPRLLTEHLNAYLTEMTRAITDCGGTVDKYIGDAVVAVFGAPMALENHALSACGAALLCQQRITAFNTASQERGLPAFVTRIGLQSGPATLGCVGSTERFSYTAIGSTVNFASRMEGVNKVYGTLVLAGGQTLERAGSGQHARLLDRVRVPGLADDADPLSAYELLDHAPGPAEQAFAQARELYEAGRFSEAERAFLALAPDDPPAAALAKRCGALAAEPPLRGWDGTWRIEGK